MIGLNKRDIKKALKAGATDPASEIGSPSEVGQWILKNADQAGLSGYEYTADYHAFSQYTQFLYDVYAENMIRDHVVDENTLKECRSVAINMARKSQKAMNLAIDLLGEYSDKTADRV